MAAAHDQGERRELDMAARLHEHGVDVPFNVIDSDEREAWRDGADRFRVGKPDQERADEAWPGGGGDGRQVVPGRVGAVPSASRTTGTMARKCSREASSGTTPPYLPWTSICEADDGGHDTPAIFDNRGSRFVARGFDAENGACWKVGWHRW